MNLDVAIPITSHLVVVLAACQESGEAGDAEVEGAGAGDGVCEVGLGHGVEADGAVGFAHGWLLLCVVVC